MSSNACVYHVYYALNCLESVAKTIGSNIANFTILFINEQEVDSLVKNSICIKINIRVIIIIYLTFIGVNYNYIRLK